MLARLLLESPDLMLLDEPSNHLDIATTEWLESYLARQPVAMVVVSHDRYFLDKVVNKIWELHEGKITPYPGNYTQYWRLRTEKAKVLERQSERHEEKAEKLEAYIRKYGAGQRAKQAHDRERKLERLQRDQVETMRDVVGPVMRFDEVERSGDIVVEARNLSKAFDVPLFRNLNLTVERGQCVAVIGPNGAGKTTLIKTLIGREKPDSGEVKLGHKVQVGYHDQGLQSLDPDIDRGSGGLARRRSRLGGRGRPQPAGAVRPDRRARFSHRRQALRRRESQGRPGPAVRDLRQSSGHGRAHQPPRHLVARSPRALDQRVRGNRPGRQPRPLLPQQGRRSAGGPRRGTCSRHPGRLRDVSASAQGKEKERGDKSPARPRRVGRGSDSRSRPHSARAPGAPRPNESSHTARPSRSNAKSASSKWSWTSSKTCSASPATWRDPVKAVGYQDRHVELKTRLETLYEHWETALEANW